MKQKKRIKQVSQKSKITNFYKRWNIYYDENKKFTDFKNRALSTIDDTLGEIFLSHVNLQKTFLKLVAKHVPHSKYGVLIDVQKLSDAFTLKEFIDSPVYKVISSEKDFVEFIKYLQALFWLELDPEVKDKLFLGFKRYIELSLLDIQIKRIKENNIIFYPRGAKLLDKRVINDTLDWLISYPKVLNSFKSALIKYQDKTYQRNLIDDLRLSLELLLKEILNNNKSLEKQGTFLGKYLKRKNVPKELRNMYLNLINYYIIYQNNYVKHEDKVESSEIEFVIYLTGTFMRFLITLESV